MARSISEIKGAMTELFVSDGGVRGKYGLSPGDSFEERFGKASLESVLFYCVAVGIWALEKIFDLFRVDIESKILGLKPHSAQWYAGKIREYQHGVPLSDDGVYSVVDEGLRIVKHCSVVERMGGLRIKTAKSGGAGLERLGDDELFGLRNYIDRIRDAGVYYELESRNADLLHGELLVHYDPLVFNNDGGLILSPDSRPVRDAVMSYLSALPFDGVYSNMGLVERVRGVPGVSAAHLLYASASYVGVGSLPIESVYVPDAGHMALGDFIVSYTAYN